MKGLFVSVFALVIISSVSGQRRDRPQTLLGDGVEFTSGFGGFMIQLPTIDGEISSMTGGGGAVLINNRFYFGGYGLGLADDKQITVDGTDYDMDYGHGGLMLGFVIRPESLIHAGNLNQLMEQS